MNIPRWWTSWVVLGVVVAVLFGVFVWPTLYRYEHLSNRSSALVRISRFTGERSLRVGDEGWVHIDAMDDKTMLETNSPPAAKGSKP